MGLNGGVRIHWLKHWGFCCSLSGGDSVASCSLGGTGDSVPSCSFGGTFWETIFLVEGYLLFVFLSFGSF
jgi:hypothetical protein